LSLSQSDLPILIKGVVEVIKYTLFYPYERQGPSQWVMPAYGYFDYYLKAAYDTEAIYRLTTADISTALDIYDDLTKMQHQTGINLPGIESNLEADGANCGLLGFTMHDNYHCDTASNIPPHHHLTNQRIFSKCLTPCFQKKINQDQQTRAELFLVIDRDHYYYRYRTEDLERKFAIGLIDQTEFDRQLPQEKTLAFVDMLQRRLKRALYFDGFSQVRHMILKDSEHWIDLGWTQEQLEVFRKAF